MWPWLWSIVFDCFQAPASAKARMFKVLKEIVEDGTSGSRTESGVSCLKLDPLYCYGHSTLQTVFGLQRSSV